jgi:hypothetical protein
MRVRALSFAPRCGGEGLLLRRWARLPLSRNRLGTRPHKRLSQRRRPAGKGCGTLSALPLSCFLASPHSSTRPRQRFRGMPQPARKHSLRIGAASRYFLDRNCSQRAASGAWPFLGMTPPRLFQSRLSGEHNRTKLKQDSHCCVRCRCDLFDCCAIQTLVGTREDFPGPLVTAPRHRDHLGPLKRKRANQTVGPWSIMGGWIARTPYDF